MQPPRPLNPEHLIDYSMSSRQYSSRAPLNYDIAWPPTECQLTTSAYDQYYQTVSYRYSNCWPNGYVSQHVGMDYVERRPPAQCESYDDRRWQDTSGAVQYARDTSGAIEYPRDSLQYLRDTSDAVQYACDKVSAAQYPCDTRGTVQYPRDMSGAAQYRRVRVSKRSRSFSWQPRRDNSDRCRWRHHRSRSSRRQSDVSKSSAADADDVRRRRLDSVGRQRVGGHSESDYSTSHSRHTRHHHRRRRRRYSSSSSSSPTSTRRSSMVSGPLHFTLYAVYLTFVISGGHS